MDNIDKDSYDVYKIYDLSDKGYDAWHGTIEDIVEYLEEHKDNINNYNKEDGWVKNLERYGLTYEVIYTIYK